MRETRGCDVEIPPAFLRLGRRWPPVLGSTNRPFPARPGSPLGSAGGTAICGCDGVFHGAHPAPQNWSCGASANSTRPHSPVWKISGGAGGFAGDEFREEDHPYADDLDLFGEGSLFELLAVTRTGIGRATLADWMKAPAARGEALARQEAVAELEGSAATAGSNPARRSALILSL